MSLPSKKIVGIVVACVLVIVAAARFKDSEMLGGNGSLIAVQKNNSAPPLKSKTFYEQSIDKATSSMTDSLSRDFFLNFVDLQNKGNWNIDSQAALIENMTTSYATSAPKLVKVSDLAVFSDRESAKVRDFGNAMAKTMEKYSKSLEVSPFDILGQAVNGEISSTTFRENLSYIYDSYALLSKDLAKIPAPASFAATYADIINTYYAIGIDVDNMRFYWIDPVKSLIGMTNYQKDLMRQMDLLKSTANYFNSNAILFSNTEEGKLWTSLLQLQ